MNGKLATLEAAINHRFTDKKLLKLALTHRSFAKQHNERLEYLGDAILGFVIADRVFHQFPPTKATEGDLTRLRSTLVRDTTLAKLAYQLHLADYIKLGQGELNSDNTIPQSMLANVFEAVIGAIYLDSDIATCSRCITFIYSDLFCEISLDALKDAKTALQELLQSRKKPLPLYKVLSVTNINNRDNFAIACEIPGTKISAHATAFKKSTAEQLAAEKALVLLNQAIKANYHCH